MKTRGLEPLEESDSRLIETFPARLRRAIGDEPVRAFAARAGISEGALRNLMMGGMPRMDNLMRIARAAGVSCAWLIGEAPPQMQQPDGELVVMHPRGEGGRPLAFHRQWLHQAFDGEPPELFLLAAHDDAMEPTLRAGAYVLADCRLNGKPSRDGLYVIRMGEIWCVRRIQRVSGAIRLISDNRAYAPLEFEEERLPDDITIAGRVVWFGHQM